MICCKKIYTRKSFSSYESPSLKIGTAITGVMMAGFLFAHLSGSLLVFLGPNALNDYAAKLRDFPILLWGLRFALLFSTIFHVTCAITLTKRNRKARPIPYGGKVSPRFASFSSRTMPMTGLLILLFVLFHLAHLTWRILDDRLVVLDHFQVYEMLVITFQSPMLIALYTFAIIAMVLHLRHGLESLLQTFGLRNSFFSQFIHKMAIVLPLGLGLGFLSGPFCIFLGFIS